MSGVSGGGGPAVNSHVIMLVKTCGAQTLNLGAWTDLTGILQSFTIAYPGLYIVNLHANGIYGGGASNGAWLRVSFDSGEQYLGDDSSPHGYFSCNNSIREFMTLSGTLTFTKGTHTAQVQSKLGFGTSLITDGSSGIYIDADWVS